MALYAIACSFKVSEDSQTVEGMAICSDPDTPELFIYPNGTPYPGHNIWSYQLKHFAPWAKVLD